MPTHKLRKDWKAKLKSAVPFGLGQVKPKHFRYMAAVAWKNRDNLAYAWKVLSRGVCDGCALGVAGFHDWTTEGIHLCMTRLNLLRLNTMPALDAKLLDEVDKLKRHDNTQLRGLGRLAHPMVREKNTPGFRRIAWEEALGRIAARIRGSEPRRLAFYLTSRGITNEVYYVAQKVARYLGTNNIDNAARLCHSPSTGAMKHALGVGASTCSYRDWYGTDLIIFFGANPANDQPVATKYLHEAKKYGTKVVLVNPYREPGMERYWVPSIVSSATFGTDIMDYWFPVSTGGDIAFLCGVLKVLIREGWQDRDFIQNHTTGFEALEEELAKLDFADLEAQSGLGRESMQEFTALIHQAKSAVLVWSMGVTQHAFGGDTVQMILNLGLTKGFVGRDKCGLMPIRGHSSVQGGAEMGAYATAFPGGSPINAANAAALAQVYGFPVPNWQGLTAPKMIEAAAQGELDLLYCVGGNFLRTLPEPEHVRRALANVPMRVHQDIILTDQMFVAAQEEVILLPAKTRYEQDDGGTETSTERRIMFSPEIARQVGEARAEWKILRDLAAAVYPERAQSLGCQTGWQIREEIARVVSFYDGVQHLKESGDAVQYGGPHLCAGWKFPTPDGKAHFRAVPLPAAPPGQAAPETRQGGLCPSGGASASGGVPGGVQRALGIGAVQDVNARVAGSARFIVSTRRGKQFNSLVYADVDPINGAPRDAVLMSCEDAAELQVRQNDRVLLKNEIGQFEGRVFLAPIARGNLQIHWPEGNVLIRRGVTDPAGGVPDYNSRVSVQRVTGD
jgi:molybdopterin-dependent oxidoreductase alpha subunit